MAADARSTAVAGTFYLIFIQFSSRGLTFLGNQALLRYVSPGHLGLAVQLEALSISVLYTARESLRVALQRSPQSPSQKADGEVTAYANQAAINIAWLVVIIGCVLGSLLSAFYLYPAGADLLVMLDFKVAFWLYAAATIFELLSEPYFVVIQQNALFKDRARAETAAAISRCVSACLTAFIMHRRGKPMSVLPFAVGQLLYGFTLPLIYSSSVSSVASSYRFSLLPTKLKGRQDAYFDRFSKPLLALAGAFYGQSIFKWLLTQGDTLVLSLFADLQSQGIFALASNYGGLASRLLFQPIEENSRNMFGNLLASTSRPIPPQATRANRKTAEASQQRREALQYISSILHIYTLAIVIPCTTLLPQIFPVLISTLLGSKSQWNSSQTQSLLSAYSYYIPCLAVNGVLDAFVTSVATETELGAQSLMMVGVTMIYLSAAYLNMTILQLGAMGLVYANIMSMLLRIGFSIWFIRAWTEENIPHIPQKGKQLPFQKFVVDSIPSNLCLFTSLMVLVALQAQGHVKHAFNDDSAVGQLSSIRFGRLDLDFFDLSYLFSAAVVLVSTILITERAFLAGVVEPVVPQKVKEFLGRPKTA